MKGIVFGLWHLGCVTAAALAKLGHTVTGLDKNAETITNLNNNKAPLFEPGLDDLIKDNRSAGRLSFTTDVKTAFSGNPDFLWVAFDTPVDENDNADVEFVRKEIESLFPYFNNNLKIIISSQLPIGFTAKLEKSFAAKHPDKKVFFASSPENLRLGKALKVFLEPDRIVIGIRSEDHKKEYEPFIKTITDKIEWMKTESAEMTKHAINSFLATSVTFINEIASLCEFFGADAKEVSRGLKSEERIGPKAYLGPGVAFSGGTLARDIVFLSALGKQSKLPLHLLNSVKQSNDYHKNYIIRKCKELFGSIKKKQITVLGLTYKPGTDTLRRSLSVELCRALAKEGAVITAFDPAVKEIPAELKKFIKAAPDISSAIANPDCIIVSTEWPEFKNLNDQEKALLKGKIVIDPNGFMEASLNLKETKYIKVGKIYEA